MLCRFKDCLGLAYKKIAGESAAVNTDMRDVWLGGYERYWKGMSHGTCTTWMNCLPDKMLAVEGQSCQEAKCQREGNNATVCEQ